MPCPTTQCSNPGQDLNTDCLQRLFGVQSPDRRQFIAFAPTLRFDKGPFKSLAFYINFKFIRFNRNFSLLYETFWLKSGMRSLTCQVCLLYIDMLKVNHLQSNLSSYWMIPLQRLVSPSRYESSNVGIRESPFIHTV